MRLTRLPESVNEDGSLRDRARVFYDRRQAGGALAELLQPLELSRPLVLAIPCGGVPVGTEVARALNGELDLILARKLQVPGHPEAGFGACTAQGPVFMNQDLVTSLGLSALEIKKAEEKTREELRRREEVFRGKRPLPSASGRQVVLVDDGLASGYTMRAAAAWARQEKPALLVVAAPTGHLSTVARLARSADYLVCPNIRGGYSFAVADAYELWYDLDDQEVLSLLDKFWQEP